MASSSLPPSPVQTAYTCDTLPPPQNLRLDRSLSPAPPDPDVISTAAFDVPTIEEVRGTASPSMLVDVDVPAAPQPPARKLCVRHQRMADEGTNLKLQQFLDALPLQEREAVNSIWSNFSSSSHPCRALILQGLLTMCCFSQLSLLTEQLAHLIRIDPFSILPREVSLQVLGSLDAISLCRAAQVSKHWRDLADDDILWRSICEQHIGQKCHKCGWGLPLLEKRRTIRTPCTPSPAPSSTSSKRVLEDPGPSNSERPLKRAKSESSQLLDLHISPQPSYPDRRPTFSIRHQSSPSSTDIADHALHSLSFPAVDSSPPPTLTRPWKDIYSERLTIERNWRRGRCTVRLIKGHTDGVMCMQFSETLQHPSFPVLITGSYDRTARVWNLETGVEVRCLRGHTRAVRALQFDEAKLVTGSMDHTIRVWNWRTGACIRTLEGHTEGVVCLNFDSNVLASGSVDTTVKVWNFRTGECFTLRGHRDWVNSVQLWDSSPSSAVVGGVCAPPMFDAPAAGEGGPFLTIDPGKMLFSASDDGTIRLWDLNLRACVRLFAGHVGQVQSLKLVVVDEGCDSEASPAVPAPGTPPLSHAAPRDALSTLPSRLPGFAPASVSIPTILPPDHPGFDALAFSPPAGFDPYAYRSASSSSAATPSGSFLHTSSSTTVSRQSPTPSAKSAKTVLISGSLDNTIKVWDVESGQSLRTLFGHIEGVWAVASDKLRLVSGSHDRTIKVWVREEGRCMATLVGHRGAVTCLALGDDKIVSGSDDGDIRIWSFSA